MPKTLIIGPNFHYFVHSIEQAFSALGYETKALIFDVPIHPFTLFNKVCYQLSTDRKSLEETSRKQNKKDIECAYHEFSPDIVYIVNGEILEPETVRMFKQKSKVVLWMFDSITRIDRLKALVKDVDYIFCYDSSDIEWCHTQGVEAHFLPQACDETIYHPLHLKKDIDILFVGELYYSKKRQKYIKTVIDAFPNKKILIFGKYKPWYKGFFSWLFREKRNIYKNHDLHNEEVNKYYNRAKVVLNIHHEQQTNGANPKVFEICGSGAYQVCDSNPYIKSLFPSGEIGLYKNEKELVKHILYALEHDMTQESHTAHQRIYTNHTFTSRIKEMLSLIK